jgi:hypothetical protein
MRCLRTSTSASSKREVDAPDGEDAVSTLPTRSGGLIRNNGPSGWLTLSRGMQDLTLLERGWRIAALRILRFPVINEQTGPCPYTENVSDEYSSIGDV